jgi:wobble nucleotide-excising tRNase
MRKVKKQLENHQELLKNRNEMKDVVDAGKDLIKKIDAWEGNLVQVRQKNFQDVINFPSKLNTEFFAVRSVVDVHDPRVTQGARDRFADLEKEWSTYQQQMKSLQSNDLAKYNDLFKQKNIPAVVMD